MNSKLNEILNTQYFTLLLTNKCNYECEYCDQRNFRKSQDMSIDTVKAILEYCKLVTKNKISFHLFGGEPTLNPDIFEIVDLIKLYNYEICMTTNLSQSVDFYKKLDITTVASYHHEYTDKAWIERANALDLKHISLMWQPSCSEEIRMLNNSLENKCIIVPIDQYIDNGFDNFQNTFKDKTPFEYEIEQNHYIGKSGKRLFCSSGLIIDESGDVHYCWSNYQRGIGNIKDLKKYSVCHICNNYNKNCDEEIVRSDTNIILDNNIKDLKTQWIFCNA